jgi:Protein of unknown function (DUF4230)
MNRLKIAALSLVVCLVLTYYIHLETSAPDMHNSVLTRETVIHALADESQIVGLSGTTSKTVIFDDTKWYGDRKYEITVTGTFKLGANITREWLAGVQVENGIVSLPKPHIVLIGADFPYDAVTVDKQVGWFRRELTDEDLQALYRAARTQAVSDVLRDSTTRQQAERNVERTIRELLMAVPGVKDIRFKGGDEQE